MATYRNKGKKSLKQPDEFITFSSRLLRQVILYKARIIMALGALVAVILIVSAIGYFSKRAENSSLVLLNQAMAKYASIQTEKNSVEAHAAVKDDLQQVIQSNGNKASGKLACLFLANSCYAAGDYDQAVVLYKKAEIAFKGAVPLESLAAFSIGYALEQKGDKTGAIDVFSKIPTDAGRFLGDEALFALGRLYQSEGKADQQIEASKKLLETFPESIYVDVVKETIPDSPQQKG